MNFRYLRKLLAAAAALAAFAALTPPGAGATTTPAPGYEQFAGCPHPGESPSITTCFREVITGGELQMGNVEMPNLNPITLSGGMTKTGKFLSSPKGGLLPVKQSVPGGVVGLTGLTWLLEYLSIEALALYAVIELASPPTDPLAEPLSLPVKIHLINPVLGKNCYIGSTAEPIYLELITGTTSPPSPNTPITGAPGTSELTLGNGITDVTEATHVDNAFSVLGANGCVLTLFGNPAENIDELIDAEAGFPAAAGSNTAILDFETEFVSASLVYP